MFDLPIAFFQGLVSLLDPVTFGLMLVGIVLALITGLLPGIGSLTIFAVIVPFVVLLDPIPAMALMVSLFVVGDLGGDITSILFGIPGEGTSAALILDGHPMAKQGLAGEAIGADIAAAAIGAVVSVLALLLSIPIISLVVLGLLAPELLLLSLMGVAFIAALSGGAAMRGYASAGLGLLLASIGFDLPTGSIPRYTFGIIPLLDGMSIIPMAMGLFALPEIIDLGVRRSAIAGEAQHVSSLKNVLHGVRQALRYRWLVVRASLLGTFIGVIPGLGGAVAQWSSYGLAVQSAKDRSEFGRGDIRGVIGPAAALNAKDGGAFIPTLGFGIPGSLSMALLLGLFIVMGIQPGPKLLTDNMDLIMAIIAILLVSQLLATVLILPFLNQLPRVTKVPYGAMASTLLTMIILGAYSESRNMDSVFIMLFFGVLGYVMSLLRWPRPPLVLAFVLGPLIERYLYLTMNIYGWSAATRWQTLLIGVLLMLVLVWPLLKSLLPRLRLRGPSEVGQDAAERQG